MYFMRYSVLQIKACERVLKKDKYAIGHVYSMLRLCG